jgi:hypothetical protein
MAVLAASHKPLSTLAESQLCGEVNALESKLLKTVVSYKMWPVNVWLSSPSSYGVRFAMPVERAGGLAPSRPSRKRFRRPARGLLSQQVVGRYILGKEPIPRARGKCGQGMTLKHSHTRHLPSGKTLHVPARCIPAQGLTAILGPAVRRGVAKYKFKHAGILRRHGYAQNAPLAKRHEAILSALKEWPDKLGLLRHMNLIVTRSRNRGVNRSGVANMAADVQWLGKLSGYKGFAKGRQLKLIHLASKK